MPMIQSGAFFKGTILSSPSRIFGFFLDFSFLEAILGRKESPTVSKLMIQ